MRPQLRERRGAHAVAVTAAGSLHRWPRDHPAAAPRGLSWRVLQRGTPGRGDGGEHRALPHPGAHQHSGLLIGGRFARQVKGCCSTPALAQWEVSPRPTTASAREPQAVHLVLYSGACSCVCSIGQLMFARYEEAGRRLTS